MTQFEHLVHEYKALVPFRIRYKDEAWEMQLLNLFVFWFCPGFLNHYTTVIGSTIYFPSRYYVETHPQSAMRTLAHEVVHLLDSERLSLPLFMGGYLFPQVLALGVFLFPFIGIWALGFLLFLLPIPAPFRFYAESRAYAMDVLTAQPAYRESMKQAAVSHFSDWNYYKMFPFEDQVKESIDKWVVEAEAGRDPVLLKVLLVYELVAEA
ncbi:MAG: hypothetical protein AAF206_26670 [Bacteroidota bacterium]